MLYPKKNIKKELKETYFSQNYPFIFFSRKCLVPKYITNFYVENVQNILGSSRKQKGMKQQFAEFFQGVLTPLRISIHMSYITFQFHQVSLYTELSKMLSPLGKFRKEIIFNWNMRAALHIFQHLFAKIQDFEICSIMHHHQ